MPSTIFHSPAIYVLGIVWMMTQALSGQEGQQIFDASLLHEIRLTSTAYPNLWEDINRDYIKAEAMIDGVSSTVGVKLKGATSAHAEQKPLVIDFNEYVKGQRFDGLTKINLRNNFQDSTLQRERLAYEIYRRAGLPSPRTSYGVLYVNDDFRGICTITEMVDKTFLKRNFSSEKGSLYKGEFDFRGFKVELKEGDMDAYDQFDRYNTPLNLGDYLHLDQYLRHSAVDIIIGDWDSYAYHRHNFFIYFEPTAERLHFINWDHNYAFSADPADRDLHPVGTFPSDVNLFEEPMLRAQYEETMCYLLTYLTDRKYMEAEVLANRTVLDRVEEDVAIADPDPLINYIEERTSRLRDTLLTLGVQCSLSPPKPINNIVINKIARDKESDWVELYNASDQEIDLGRFFYLSDDPLFPKKWQVPLDIRLAPNASIRLEDESDDASVLLLNFKIKKEGGTIVMTYEDLTELQRIDYPAIENGQALLRKADGTYGLK